MATSENSEKRTTEGAGGATDGPGPFLAKVKSHLDGEYMGRIEVELLKNNEEGNSTETTGQMVTVSYLSPFYGVTPYKGTSENEGDAYSQNSYGFWAVPPDIDTTVLVIFAEGNRGQGFWIGCVQDQYMNFMVPGRASTTFNAENNGELRPTTEYNKKVETGEKNNPTQFIKPVDTLAWQTLQKSGFQNDNIRGHTSSSARREVPSMVFGWSTPGPADWRDGSPRVSYGEEFGQSQVPFNRLGGHSFVMDDGDPSMYRTSAPSEGPSAYKSLTEGGNPLYPANELMRLRTRTGHQILMHNSEDLILISHSNGTMIELTAGGKIDIYAKDSVNIHATTDINLKADRNINMEAGSAINMKSGTTINQQSGADFNLKVGANGNITTAAKTNIRAGGMYVTSNPVHFNGPPAAGAASAPSPTRVPAGGGWSGAENLNPAAHTPAQTDNAPSTSSPPVGTDGTTAAQTPAAAGQQNTHDTFTQCPPMAPAVGASSEGDAGEAEARANASKTKNPDKAVLTSDKDVAAYNESIGGGAYKLDGKTVRPNTAGSTYDDAPLRAVRQNQSTAASGAGDEAAAQNRIALTRDLPLP